MWLNLKVRARFTQRIKLDSSGKSAKETATKHGR